MVGSSAVRLVIGVRQGGPSDDSVSVSWQLQLCPVGSGKTLNLASQSRVFTRASTQRGISWARDRGRRLAAQHGYDLAATTVYRRGLDTAVDCPRAVSAGADVRVATRVW